jgi:L-amino acid N-acyltransferase YncA
MSETMQIPHSDSRLRMSSFNIREARPEDVNELIVLFGEHAEFEQAQFDPHGKIERLTSCLFGDSPRLYCLVLENLQGELLGYATFTFEFSTWDVEHYFHVDCLYLREAARNRGVGWIFGKRIATEMVQRGARTMQFQTPTFNDTAIRIYQAMGATRKDKARFYATRDDALRFINR